MRAVLVVAAASLLLVTGGVVPANGVGSMHPSAIVAPQAVRSDEGGSDFNGDGYADLAVSARIWSTTDEGDASSGVVYSCTGRLAD